MNVIETHTLTKYYGKNRGIENLDLEVKQGDFYGFIGPNGAGKSTTIRTLLGLISKTSGSSEIFGMDTAKDNRKILSDIGYMPSEAIFYGKMKVKDIISLSAKLRGQNYDKEAKNLCECLQLDVNKRIDELSLGNRKKTAIVCALQHNPNLYILDEPTSGLDPLMQREFFALLEERHNNGATIFLSSHVLSEIQRYCSRAAIIRNGGLIASGDVNTLAKTNTRRVVIHGAPDMTALDGVRDLKINGNTASFLFGGDINCLLAFISKNKIEDINISEPDLEEIFMHYYADGGIENDSI